MGTIIDWLLPMHFPQQLVKQRKDRVLTQQKLADAISIHVNQIKRYEAGTTQPTLEVLVKLANALHISLDNLVFGEDVTPEGKLKYQLEAIAELDQNDRVIIGEVLEGLILKYQAKRWARLSGT